MSRTIHTPHGPAFPEVPKSMTGKASESKLIDVIIEEPMEEALKHPEEGPIFKTKEEALEHIKQEAGYEKKVESSKKDGPEMTEAEYT